MRLLCVITVALWVSITAVVPVFGSDADDVQRYRNFITANAGRNGVNLADAYQRLGNLHFKRGENEAAAKCFSSALSCAKPNHVPEIALNYASLLMEKRDVKRAEVILKQALNQSPNSVKLQTALAQCYVRQDRVVEALRVGKLCGMETYQDIVSTLPQHTYSQDILPGVAKSPLQTAVLPITLAAAGTAPKTLPLVSAIPAQVENDHKIERKTGDRIKTATTPVRNRCYIE